MQGTPVDAETTGAHRAALALVLACLALWYAVALARFEWRAPPYADQAVHLSMALSLAHDGDLEFAREDLERFRAVTPYVGGPAGLFLKEAAPGRYVHAKPFLYALAAAPLVRVFGPRAMFALNAACALVLVATLLVALRGVLGPAAAAVLAASFALATPAHAFVYVIHPDLFIAALLALGGTLAVRATTLRTTLPLLLGAALLGAAAFERPALGLALLPLVVGLASKHGARRGAWVGLAFSLAWAAPSAVQVLQDGELFAYRGDRFYVDGGSGYPHEPGFERGGPPSTTAGLFEAGGYLQALATNAAHLPRKAFDALFGRIAGVVPYFAPALALLFFALARVRTRVGVAALAALALYGLLHASFTPGNGYGGAHTLGSRYVLQALPLAWIALAGARDEVRRAPLHAMIALAAAALALSLHPPDPAYMQRAHRVPATFLDAPRAQAFPWEPTLLESYAALRHAAFSDHGASTLVLARPDGLPAACHSHAGDATVQLFARAPLEQVELALTAASAEPVVLDGGAGPVTATLEAGLTAFVRVPLAEGSRFVDLMRGPRWRYPIALHARADARVEVRLADVVRALATGTFARPPSAGCITERAAEAARLEALPPLAPDGTLRVAAGTAGAAYLGAGWSLPEPWGTWTDSTRARLRLPIARANAALELTFIAHALAPAGAMQTVDVHANGVRVATWTLPIGGPAQRYVAIVPSLLLEARPALELELAIARPVTPRALGLGPDDRTLGLALSELAWRPAPEP